MLLIADFLKHNNNKSTIIIKVRKKIEIKCAGIVSNDSRIRGKIIFSNREIFYKWFMMILKFKLMRLQDKSL